MNDIYAVKESKGSTEGNSIRVSSQLRCDDKECESRETLERLHTNCKMIRFTKKTIYR